MTFHGLYIDTQVQIYNKFMATNQIMSANFVFGAVIFLAEFYNCGQQYSVSVLMRHSFIYLFIQNA